MTTLIIRSGGQTGVDRAALDAAVAAGLDYAGWVPKGGWAEDMEDPPGLLARYPKLCETPERDTTARTRFNVRDADATLVLLPAARFDASPGTALTIHTARAFAKPFLVLALGDPGALKKTLDFIRKRGNATPGCALDFNIAGPRESEAPGIAATARSFLDAALSRLDSGRA